MLFALAVQTAVQVMDVALKMQTQDKSELVLGTFLQQLETPKTTSLFPSVRVKTASTQETTSTETSQEGKLGIEVN